MKLKSDVNKQTEHWGAKSLPKLSDYDTNVALSHENRIWAMNFSKLENIGKIHFMEEMSKMMILRFLEYTFKVNHLLRINYL